jgi:hypothetical protein
MSPRSETWFDRLSAPHTRREGVKAAVAGAAAAVGAGLPWAGRVADAKAATPTDCRKGCVWAAKQRYASRLRAQQGAVLTLDAVGSFGGFGILDPFMAMWTTRTFIRNTDRLWNEYRQDEQVCFQPFCPGFDPKKPGGPCDGCDPPLYCNPCELVDSGYICCIYEPSDCHGDCCHPSPGCP